MKNLEIRRLGAGDEQLAEELFRLFAEVFEEPYTPLTFACRARLLNHSGFWVLAAWTGGQIAGGITAHCLPMTRSEEPELFVYDLAVHSEHQRKGIGRALVEKLLADAAAQGLRTAFVAVENEDAHALEFYRAIGGRETASTIFVFP